MADWREQFRALGRQMSDLQDEQHELVRRALPVGEYVEVRYGRGTLRGWVARHGPTWMRRPRVVLTLASTGGEFWIDAHHFVEDREATRRLPV